MVAYYISYGEPRRRFPWWLVAVMAGVGVVGAGAVAGVLLYLSGGDDDAGRADAPPTVTFATAVTEVFAPDSDTMYLVDISGSIEASGHLRDVRQALSMLALDASGPAGDAVASGSRAALLTLGGESREPESVIRLSPLDTQRAQDDWLVAANGLAPSGGGGSFIYDAVDATLRQLLAEGDDDAGRENVLVILSDGIDGGVGKCRPVRPGDTDSGLCVGPGGDPLPCDDLPGMRGISPREICEGIYSATDPDQLLAQLAEGSVTVHTIGYGQYDHHEWLTLAAEATGGKYHYAGR